MSGSIHCTILAGPKVAAPLSASVVETVKQVEVTHSDEEGSGFQITFTAGRSGLASRVDYPILSNPQLQVFNRIIILVTLNFTPSMLIDGIITHVQLNPSDEPGDSTVVITGQDVSVMMDREDKTAEHPAQNDYIIVNKIIASYAQYAITPVIIPPPVLDTPVPTDRIPVQLGSDLEYVQKLAKRYDYVFYIAPSSVPFVNIGYWGPPKRVGLLQKALSVNMGPNTNVNAIQFRYDALKPSIYSAYIQARNLETSLPVRTFSSVRPPLSRSALSSLHVSKRQLKRLAGLSYQKAQAKAQAKTEASRKKVVIAEGNIDVSRYGGVLQARGLVGLRGAGNNYDGEYYVKEVSHILKPGQYQQKFTLTRDGVGSTLPFVRP